MSLEKSGIAAVVFTHLAKIDGAVKKSALGSHYLTCCVVGLNFYEFSKIVDSFIIRAVYLREVLSQA